MDLKKTCTSSFLVHVFFQTRGKSITSVSNLLFAALHFLVYIIPDIQIILRHTTA